MLHCSLFKHSKIKADLVRIYSDLMPEMFAVQKTERNRSSKKNVFVLSVVATHWPENWSLLQSCSNNEIVKPVQ